MDTDTFVGWQWGVTLLIALGIAVYLYMRVQRSRKRDAQAESLARTGDRQAERRADRPG